MSHHSTDYWANDTIGDWLSTSWGIDPVLFSIHFAHEMSIIGQMQSTLLVHITTNKSTKIQSVHDNSDALKT